MTHEQNAQEANQDIGLNVGGAVTQFGDAKVEYSTTIHNTYSSSPLDRIIGSIVRINSKATFQNREHLRCFLQSRYKDCYEHLLQGTIYISLHLHKQVYIAPPFIETAASSTEREKELSLGTSIVDVYDDLVHGLLILGASGTGKTVLLYKLALELLARAEHDPSRPIPIIMKLSLWARKRHSIREWLIEGMEQYYQIPRYLSRYWVEKGQVIFLLDGLDEVAEDARADCVEAINAYRKDHFFPLVVCSRTEEYKTLLDKGQQLALPGAVIIQPIQKQQVVAQLKLAGQSTAALCNLLTTNTILQELVRTPLMLYMVMQIYGGKEVDDLPQMGSDEEQQQQIFKIYVQQRLRRF